MSFGFPEDAHNFIALIGAAGCRSLRACTAILQFVNGEVEHGPARENHCALHEVLKLTDISRPMPGCEPFERGRGYRGDLLLHAACILLREVMHKQRNVLRAFPQRRDVDGKDIQPVVKIVAELAVLDHLFQVAVGGGDQTHVHALSVCAAQPFEFPLLQSAQKLGLDFRRNVADLVEKEAATVRQFQTAGFLGDGAGKRAFFMTKQLTLEQAGGNGRAIQLHEGAVLAAAALVDGAGNQLLARTRLSQQKHG